MPPASRHRRTLIEVCVSSLEDAAIAAECGADRLELCAALEVGGLTPSIGMVERVLAEVEIPVMMMIRPRVGNFVLTESEFQTALTDVAAAVRAGVNGVVFGFLNRAGCVDTHRSAQVVETAGEIETVFHRAVDYTPDPVSAVTALGQVGVTRVLTSGGAATAAQGLDTIKAMIDAFQGGIQVLPGGGIRKDNARELVQRTGCNQVHLGAWAPACDSSLVMSSGPELFDASTLSKGQHRRLDPEAVVAVARALQP